MPSARIVVTIEDRLLREVDRWVTSGEYPNRSRVVHGGLVSLREKRARGRRLLRELASLDPEEERGLAEEALRDEVHRTAR